MPDAAVLDVVSGPDLDAIDRVMAHIEANLKLWSQTGWFVRRGDRITACFGGWTALLDGWKPDFGRYTTTGTVERDGQTASVSYVATARLRLTAFRADRLFAGSNTLADQRQVVAELHGAPSRPLSWEDGTIWSRDAAAQRHAATLAAAS